MRHRVKGRSFGRVRKQRVWLMRHLARALILNDKIETTLAKAKELRSYVERLVTIAKKDTVANRRLVVSRLGNDKESAKKLFDDIAKRFDKTPGGYTRIIKLGKTMNKSTDKAIIEFVK